MILSHRRFRRHAWAWPALGLLAALAWATPSLPVANASKGGAAPSAPQPTAQSTPRVAQDAAARDDDFRQRWSRIDPARLGALIVTMEALGREFESSESGRNRLLTDLDVARSGYEPGVMSPEMVVRRQKIERLLGRLHDAIERQRQIESQGGWLLGLIENNKTQIEQAIQRVATNRGANGAAAMPRLDRLNAAMAALRANQRGRWAKLLLGNMLGPLAMRAIGQEDSADVPSSASGGALSGPARRRLMDRQEQVDELAKSQRELAGVVARQGQEIERLRRLVEAKASPALPAAGSRPTSPTAALERSAPGEAALPATH
jgi:hypothetical protein